MFHVPYKIIESVLMDGQTDKLYKKGLGWVCYMFCIKKGSRICFKPNCFTALDASTKMCSCLDYTVLQPSINPTAPTQLLQPNFFNPSINPTASTKYQPNCFNQVSTQLLQPNINPTASTKYQPNWPCNP